MMVQTLLIANRGEIASRIIRTCRKMGIQTIAVYADADRDAPFVQLADQAVYLGASPAADSYLQQERIIQLALDHGANAIHPGYGFLSEQAGFAQRCKDAGLIFIGPHPAAIAAMGSKSNAKAIMAEHGVPVIPGYRGEDQNTEKLSVEAMAIGFPVLLKAAAGGGGKGMRIVHEKKELETAIQSAKREALAAFGDDELLIEKYFPSARHIEFQIFGDQHGNAIHLLERECTIQRRYQKIIEESPSPVLSAAMRQKMGEAAVKAAQAIQYDNAGTVEFIYIDEDSFYFLEVNTRLQVEHPVTEAITGLDLVEWQIRIAEGAPLPWQQSEVKSRGYALECRLYAEDPSNNFLPVTGKIQTWKTVDLTGLRYDSAVESGSEISIFYDPMIAKIITHGPDRLATIRSMQYAMSQLVCLGLTTNQAFLNHLLLHPDFIAGNYDTHFIQNQIDLSQFVNLPENSWRHALIGATLQLWKKNEQGRALLQHLPSGWRNNFYQPQEIRLGAAGKEWIVRYRQKEGGFQFFIDDAVFAVECLTTPYDEQLRFVVDGLQRTLTVVQKNDKLYVHWPQYGNLTIEVLPRFPVAISEELPGTYQSPMPGEIIEVLVSPGQVVAAGDSLILLSSMKMENTIAANAAGTVEEVFVQAGQRIEAGFLLLKISEN